MYIYVCMAHPLLAPLAEELAALHPQVFYEKGIKLKLFWQ